MIELADNRWAMRADEVWRPGHGVTRWNRRDELSVSNGDAAGGSPARASDAASTEPAILPRSGETLSPSTDAGMEMAAPTSAAMRYAEAEDAMRRNDRDAARLRLLAVVDEFPTDPLAATALFELARLTFGTREYAVARRYLDTLSSAERGGRDAALREPTAYLRCRVEMEALEHDVALRCMIDFRRNFPNSAHAAEVLATLATTYADRGNCAATKPLLEEYLAAYPDGRASAAIRGWQNTCANDP